jgi:nitrogen regulatory protein P-II 2
MTELFPVTCVTIIAESILERRLLDDLESVGALGWTVTTAQGHGPRDRRVSEIEGGNIRVEVLASQDVVERIWDLLEEHYFPDYAMAAWCHRVEVARPQRYTGE